MDVKAIQARLAAHAVERNWDPFFSPRSLSMAVASEAGALIAIFQWLSEDQARRIGKTQDREAVAASIADLVLLALRLAETVDVDLDDVVLARAAEKYPVTARRFEGVDDMDARESEVAPRESPQRQPEPQREPDAPAPAAATPRRWDSVAGHAPLRAAPDGAGPARSPPPVPVHPRVAKAVEEDPVEETRIELRPVEAAAIRPPDRLESQSRKRPEPAARARSAPPPRADPEPPTRERADPPARERAAPPAPVEPPPRAERYANLDTNAVLDLVKGLKKRIDDSRSDDVILHEIKDEIDTLRRNVYSSKSKPAWIAGGLERLRGLLEEAAVRPVGDKVNFKDYISRISKMLDH